MITFRFAVAYLAVRSKEASSMAGAAVVVLAMLGLHVDPTFVGAVLSAVAAVGGVVAILVPESGKPAAVLTVVPRNAPM